MINNNGNREKKRSMTRNMTLPKGILKIYDNKEDENNDTLGNEEDKKILFLFIFYTSIDSQLCN